MHIGMIAYSPFGNKCIRTYEYRELELTHTRIKSRETRAAFCSCYTTLHDRAAPHHQTVAAHPAAKHACPPAPTRSARPGSPQQIVADLCPGWLWQNDTLATMDESVAGGRWQVASSEHFGLWSLVSSLPISNLSISQSPLPTHNSNRLAHPRPCRQRSALLCHLLARHVAPSCTLP